MDKFADKSLRKNRRRRRSSNKVKVKSIFNFLGNVVIALLIVFVGFSIYGNIQTKGKAYKTPAVGPYMWMSVLSNSMKPVFCAGDLIIDKKVDPKNLNKGDIVTFVWGSSLSTHRIEEVIKDSKGNISFRTKGDNNNVSDLDIISSNKVVGKYMFRVPLVGYVLTKLRGLIGIILIWVMFISVIGSEVYKNIKNTKKNKINETITQQ